MSSFFDLLASSTRCREVNDHDEVITGQRPEINSTTKKNISKNGLSYFEGKFARAGATTDTETAASSTPNASTVVESFEGRGIVSSPKISTASRISPDILSLQSVPKCNALPEFRQSSIDSLDIAANPDLIVETSTDVDIALSASEIAAKKSNIESNDLGGDRLSDARNKNGPSASSSVEWIYLLTDLLCLALWSIIFPFFINNCAIIYF